MPIEHYKGFEICEMWDDYCEPYYIVCKELKEDPFWRWVPYSIIQLRKPKKKQIKELMPVQSKTIKIELYGGCVTEVTGLPEGYDYEIVDHDHLEAEQDASSK